jgi:hypothetical protein
MCGRTAGTDGDADLLELLADRAPVNAQLGTDLAPGPALSVQVGCTLNVHGGSVMGPETTRESTSPILFQ